jgi:hypothetical protein
LREPDILLRRARVDALIIELWVASTTKLIRGAATRVVDKDGRLVDRVGPGIVEIRNASAAYTTRRVPITTCSGCAKSLVVIERTAHLNRAVTFLDAKVVPYTIAHTGTTTLRTAGTVVGGASCKTSRC